MMNKKHVVEALKLAREFSKKRNFSQTVDLIFNLKEINLKNPEENVDSFLVLPHATGKVIKVCALVDKDMTEAAKVFDKVVPKTEFINYGKNPKLTKKLADEFDYFIAEATIMTDIAKTFGKVLGIKGKMPNPKAGCIVAPGADLKALKERLSKTVRLKTRNEKIVKIGIGKEDMSDEDLMENINSIYNSISHSLPKEEANIKEVLIKLTMGSSIKVGESKEDFQKRTGKVKKDEGNKSES